MLVTIRKELGAKLIVLFFLLFAGWWFLLNLMEPADIQYHLFGATYGLVALVGALFGLSVANKWGGFKSLMGRSIMMFSLGLLAQEFGQIVYSFYTFFLQVEIPYPSIGDLGYFGSIFFYIYGVWLLLRVSGVKIAVGSGSAKILAILIPAVLLLVSYILFLKGYPFEGTPPLVVFLDFGYPFGEAIYISLAILTYLLSQKILGGIMRSKILFVLFALLVQFLADYSFLYLSRYASIGPGGINDFIYLLAYFLMGIALIQLKTVSDSLHSKK